mmetsp:Transcript_70218/g.195425  ORF Transcript_70218/g.195425 Transcript_70218/m.195425 type:complete len:145 (+) Transcript_70218:146-580(+)
MTATKASSLLPLPPQTFTQGPERCIFTAAAATFPPMYARGRPVQCVVILRATPGLSQGRRVAGAAMLEDWHMGQMGIGGNGGGGDCRSRAANGDCHDHGHRWQKCGLLSPAKDYSIIRLASSGVEMGRAARLYSQAPFITKRSE